MIEYSKFQIFAFAKENGFEQLNLEVRSRNIRAIHLYEKYGFRKLCTFPHFFKINDAAGILHLRELEKEWEEFSRNVNKFLKER